MPLSSDQEAVLIAVLARLVVDNASALANSTSPVSQPPEPKPDGRGGRLASRLIQDWFAGRLGQDEHDWPAEEPAVDKRGEPPTECPPLRVFPPRPDAGSDHDLVIIGSQSYDEAHDPEGRGRWLLSCMCRHCRYHFVFRIHPHHREESTAHLQHHFRVEDTEWHTISGSAVSQHSHTNLRQGQFRYACTLCGMIIHLEISLPRLKPRWIKMIMDEDRIRESLRTAREESPNRYADVTAEKEAHYATSALSTLNQYLKNILDDDGTGPRKRISFRNRTFRVQFGRDCEHIFRHLGFEEFHDESTGENYWLPPQLAPQEGKTPIGSSRAFYEDVRSEVQSLLEDSPPVNGHPVVKPISARDQLEKALGCDRTALSASMIPVGDNEAAYFTTLGAPVDADDAMLKFAYNRQVETDPVQTSVYLEALGALSARRAMELQMFVFTQQELLAKKRKEVTAAAAEAGPLARAYAHFGLSRDCPEAPDYFIRVYRTYREQSPAQKSDHRLALLQIGRDRASEEILSEVFGKPMELAEACQFLRVESEWPMDSIAAIAQSLAPDMDLDNLDLLLMALEAFSQSRREHDPNRREFEQVVTELRSSRQLLGLSSDGGPLGAAAAAPADSREPVDMDLPVGLANLRNTCYLNSILQYFYSVNAVRNLALNADLPALEPTEANLRNILRSTGSSGGGGGQNAFDLETGRAFVGHEFTRELSALFRALKETEDSSLFPRQRLANAALLRPEKLRPRSAETKATPGASDAQAPPLPPRAGETTVPTVMDTPMGETEQCETASCGSSQTLVNNPEGESRLITTSEAEGQRVKKGAAGAVGDAEDQASSDAVGGGPAEGEVKMSKLTVEELAAELDKPNVGSDQMDVDEVMGNAIDHLRAAFKLSRVGNPESAPDPIELAFFSTFVDNRKKIGEAEWNRTSRSDRWVTAYPAPSGTRDLYEALSNSFDLEPLPGDLLSFTTIERPAPHFHICIQRSDGVRKNSNPITIPETLYLDRFMHTTDTQSPLFRGRKRRWDINTRLSEIASSAATERPESSNGQQVQIPGLPSNSTARDGDLTEEEIDGFLVVGRRDAGAHDASSSVTVVMNGTPNGAPEHPARVGLDPDLQRLLTKYGVAEPELPPISDREPAPSVGGSTAVPPLDLDVFWEKFVAEENAERERLIAERDSIFSDSHQVAYRLHAVVCHAGSSARAGHYWVWIHDFEQDVWRKYNDTTVSVHPADFVFGELNSKGEPYYLAYVKAAEVQDLVSIPRRPPRLPPRTPPPVPPRPRSAQDATMVDAKADTVAVEHLEDVDMLPPPYSAA